MRCLRAWVTCSHAPVPFRPLGDMVKSSDKAGWQVVAHHARDNASTVRDKIKLGVLLGAGSFGRVYKGRWRDMDVAVKVMQHDAHTASRIANEAVSSDRLFVAVFLAPSNEQQQLNEANMAACRVSGRGKGFAVELVTSKWRAMELLANYSSEEVLNTFPEAVDALLACMQMPLHAQSTDWCAFPLCRGGKGSNPC